MKKRFISIVAVLAMSLSVMAGIERNNERTQNHQQFDNYAYAIVPPAGATRSAEGTGFVLPNANIQISHINMVLDGSSDHPVKQAIFKNYVEKYSKYEAVYINDTEYYLMEKAENGKTSVVLAIPEDNGTVIIEANVSGSNEATVSAVKEALLSVVYVDPTDAPESPIFENSLYQIENQGFKPVAEGSTLVTFCESGDLAKELATGRKVNFKILMNDDAVAAKQQKKFAHEVVKALLEDNEKITSEGPVTINGLNGFEYYITESKGAEIVSKSYNVVLFSAKKYYCFQSKANQEIDLYLPKFQAAAQSFKNK